MNLPVDGTNVVSVDYDPFADTPLAGVVPTTEPQREIWFASQLSPQASLAYNESISLHFRGPLVISALIGGVHDLLQRHDALRATLSPDGQSLYFKSVLTIDIPTKDLSSLSQDARHQACSTALRHTVETPFDLQQGPLIRAEVLKLSANEHTLIISAHHIVCDGWSFGVLVSELLTLYAQRCGASAAPILEAESFSQYAQQQIDLEHIQVQESDLSYWVSVFDGSIPSLDLPSDRPRRPVRGFASLRQDAVLTPALVEAVRKLGARNGASLFVTLFGMFATLMARLSNNADVVVGVPAAGQASEGLSSLVGHCVNLLPIRMLVDLEQDVATLLQASNSRVLDAYEHQQCTYGNLLKKLQVPRDASRLPLVSVLFNLDSSIETQLPNSLSALQVELQTNPRHFENFDLFLNASQVGGGVVLECQYNTDLFDGSTVARWLELLVNALDRAVADPHKPLAELFAPTASDIAALKGFNSTQAQWPKDSRVEDLIARQVEIGPDRIAVSSGDRHLSYRMLNERANALAIKLRASGISPGDLVGLACGRNEHMIVGLLGILKSGAGYVPLDPSFPQDRLSFMATDASLSCVLTDDSVSSSLKLHHTNQILLNALGAHATCPSSSANADGVAYVIYTSGSTGRPKGVLVPHRTVTNLLESVRIKPGMTNEHTVLSVTTLSFDIAVSEVILPLTVGARIVIADREQATDGDQLSALIQSQGVDFIDATPSTWRLLLAAGWKGSQKTTAICTGEPLPPDLGRELLPLVGSLWNGYGPTETTVWSSFHKVETVNGMVPIGRPIANTMFYVLDEKMRPLPLGVPGELYIGGSGVTLGYLGRPELTAERFLPDPFPGETNARCYKTGDMGRWRADGILECLGRSDHQVKLRGYRIELGEIEAVLLTDPDVHRAIVVTREDQPGDVRLVAYVVAKNQTKVTALAIQTHLKKYLPDYMVPQHVVQLESIPLLPNGKLDRSSLPAPEINLLTEGNSRAAPRSKLEQSVVVAMEAVLNLPGIGVFDDFFALGGHSLLAARLTSRLNRDFELNLPLRTLFESSTPEKLALAIEQAKHINTPHRKAILHTPHRTSAPLTPMQDRIRFVERLYPGRVLYNTPSAHRLLGSMDVPKFEQALRIMVQRQPTLRTCIGVGSDGIEHFQNILESVSFAFPYEDLSALPPDQKHPELMRRMQAIVDTPIDIYSAPLFRVSLYKLDSDEHAFLFMPHHIIWDGWSFDLLYDEMSAIYTALVAGQQSPLPPLPVSYGDFAQWQADWLQGEEFEKQLQYWKKRFAKAPLAKAPTPEKLRSAGMSGEGASEWLRLDKSLTERLREIARDADVTLNMLTMGVYTALMASVIGTNSVVIGVPIRGRSQAELEQVMGFFNNLLPLQLEVETQRSVLSFVQGIKQELLEVFSYQDIPFERLALEPEVASRTQQAGLYQALFSFQDARERNRRWGELSQKSILLFQKGATEDLGLWLMEVPDGIEGGFTYNADIYSAATAIAFKERYLELLKKVASNPAQSVAELCDSGNSLSAAYLRRLAAVTPSTGAGAVPQSHFSTRENAGGDLLSSSERQIARIWGQLLNTDVSEFQADDRFFAMGGSSLLAMSLVNQLQQHFSKKVQLNDLVSDLTLRELAQLLDPAPPGRDSLKLIRAGTGTPVFFVHDGVGETLLYRSLAMLLDTKHAVYGLQPLSSNSHPLLHTRFSDMADYHIQMIRRVQAHGPYLLAGLCAGGVIAHEIAIRLQQQAETIAMVGLMDAAEVSVERRFGRISQTRWRRFIAAIQSKHSVVKSLFTAVYKVGRLTKYEAFSAVRHLWMGLQFRILRSYLDKGKPPPSITKGLSVSDIYDFALLDDGNNDVLHGDVALFRATLGNGQQADQPCIEAYTDPQLGWGRRVTGTVHCIDVPGGHTSMLQEPHVRVLAQKMQAYIDKALPEKPAGLNPRH